MAVRSTFALAAVLLLLAAHHATAAPAAKKPSKAERRAAAAAGVARPGTPDSATPVDTAVPPAADATAADATAAAPATAAATTAAAAGDSPLPVVPGVDQSPSEPDEYGRCTGAVEDRARSSNWCQFNRLGYWPAGPSRKARRVLKFGRMTVYRGPVYGSEPRHQGACAVDLAGSNETALVAVSTKYLKTAQHGWADDKGVCGQCMCVHVRGVDHRYNPGVKFYAARPAFGLTFLGRVGDRCGECEDDHVDVLLDRPLAYAPYDPNVPTENANAVYANSLPGPRGFAAPAAMRAGDLSPETVGTWVADWNWVPCEGWSHARCAGLMGSLGYKDAWAPRATPGVDSRNLRRVDKPIGPAPWAEQRRANGGSGSGAGAPAAAKQPAGAGGGRGGAPRKAGPLPAVQGMAMCGGKAEGCAQVASPRQCEDAQWAKCAAEGHKCVRENEWYWQCLPAVKPSH